MVFECHFKALEVGETKTEESQAIADDISQGRSQEVIAILSVLQKYLLSASVTYLKGILRYRKYVKNHKPGNLGV